MSLKFKRLAAWNEAHKLVMNIYKSTRSFPPEERFGLTSQIRRAAVSISSNIVEGCERKTTKDFLQFLYVSKASLSEVRYQLLLAKDLEYLPEKDFMKLDTEADLVSKIIHGLMGSLEKKL